LIDWHRNSITLLRFFSRQKLLINDLASIYAHEPVKLVKPGTIAHYVEKTSLGISCRNMAYSVGLSMQSGASGYASFNTNASSSTASGCGCGTGESTSPIAATAGLSAINNPTAFPLIIDQGVAFNQKVCLTSGEISVPAIEMSAGPDGKLTFPTTQEICAKVGDKVRVLGLDSCKSDVGEIYVVSAVVNTDAEKSITLTGLNTGGVAKVYKQTLTSTSETVLGCITASVAASSAGPRIIQHMPSDPKFTLSGGAIARSDWSQSFGIEFAANNQWVMSRIVGMVQPGDTIVSEDAGIMTPVQVLEVRQVQTSDGSVVEKIKLAVPPKNSGCYLAHVRRGRLFTMGMEYDANGCIDLKIPASSTAGLQLLDSWRMDDGSNCDVFNVGCYTVALHWVENNAAGQPQSFSRILLRGDVYLRASHIFENEM
jgi:hypothetical protein